MASPRRSGMLLLIIVIVITLKCVLVLLANRQVGFTVALVSNDFRLEFLRSLLNARWEYYLRQPVGALANSVTGEVGRATMAYLHCMKIIALAAQAVVYTGIAMLVSLQATLAALIIRRHDHLPAESIRAHFTARWREAEQAGAVIPRAVGRQHAIDQAAEGNGPGESRRRSAGNRFLEDEARGAERYRQWRSPARAAGTNVHDFDCIGPLRGPRSFRNVVRIRLWCSRFSFCACCRIWAVSSASTSGWQHAKADIGRFERRSTEPRTKVKRPLTGIAPVLRRAIRFENVGFKYKEHWVVRNAALTIPAGGITAIVGSSGAGKTTVST